MIVMDTLTSKTLIWSTMSPSTQVLNHNFSDPDTNLSTTLAPHVSKSGVSRILLPALMSFVGVFGNVLALVILHIRPSKDSRHTAFYHLVKSLAVVDLTGILALSPVPLATHGQLVKIGGMALCHYFSFAILLAGNATQFVVLIMAVERFMVTKFPFKYPELVTHRNINIAIGSMWLLSAFLAALPIMGFSRNVERWPGTWCFFDYRDNDIDAYIFSFCYASIGLIIIVVTFILNMSVIHHLWRMRQTRLIHSSIRSQRHSIWSRQAPDSESRMVLFLLAIIMSFTLCYCPLMMRVLINQFQNVGGVDEKGGTEDRMDVWALRAASLNQIIDPWIYIISRFTCCSVKNGRDSCGDISRSPIKTSNTTVSSSPSPRRGFIQNGIDRARALFRLSSADESARNNAMVPLGEEFPEQVRASHEDRYNVAINDDVKMEHQSQGTTGRASMTLLQNGTGRFSKT